VIGKGQAAVLGDFVALFEPGGARVVVVDPPDSHCQGPIFLNVLRARDIPDALEMLAPRPLVLGDAPDRVLDRTQEVYRIAGAGDKCRRK
jgi:hypothetical protein